jgi:hypothetical protein
MLFIAGIVGNAQMDCVCVSVYVCVGVCVWVSVKSKIFTVEPSRTYCMLVIPSL